MSEMPREFSILSNEEFEVLTHDFSGQAYIPGAEPRVIPEIAKCARDYHEAKIIAQAAAKKETQSRTALLEVMKKYEKKLSVNFSSGLKTYRVGDLVVEMTHVEKELIKTRLAGENERDLSGVDLEQAAGRKLIEEQILEAIEDHAASTLTEIVEDTRLERGKVVEIVRDLIKRKTLRQVPRYIPGCSKPNYLLKSNRVNEPDAV